MDLQPRRTDWPTIIAGAALVVLAGTLVLAGWLALQEDNLLAGLAGTPPGLLRVGVSTPITTIDPVLATTPAERTLQTMVFEGVLALNPDGTLTLEPRLAESLPQPSADGLLWTINCRRNVRFHDGQLFTCLDVQVRLEALRANPDALASSDIDPTTLIALLGRIQSIEAADRFTLNVRLSAPFAFFNEALAHPAAVIARGELGTGPFQLESWDAESASLPAFDDYWGGPPELERVRLQVVPEQAERMAGLGQAFDVVDAPPPSATFDDETRVLLSSPGAQVTYMAVNPRASPLDNPQVREALRLGMDWRSIASQAYSGYAQPAPLLTSPAMPGYESLSPVEPDPRRAREIQANAALPDGYDANLVVDRRVANWQGLTETMRFQLMNLYIEGEAEALSVPPERAFDTNPPPSLVVTAKTPLDAYSALAWLTEPAPPEGRNFVGYENATYRAWLEQASAALSPEAREAALSGARETLADDSPVVFLVAPDVLAATTAEVNGLRLSPLGWVVVTRDTLVARR